VIGLESGDQLPAVATEAPGARSREFSRRLALAEAPVVNAVLGGESGVVWLEALGANILDADGNIFIDLTAGFGVAAVGHRHPAVVAAVHEQAERLVHGLADVAAHPLRAPLAEQIGRLSGIDQARVYFAISGSDAVEIALKTAWLASGKRSIVAFEPCYHGLTMGSLAATSREEFRGPFVEQLNPHVERLPHGCPLEALRALLGERDDIAAVIVEPLSGRDGALLPPAGWLAGVADLCKRHGALLIADEVFTGFGRTGSWFVCHEEGVEPDVLVCGKALGGGMPIAAVVARAELFDCWNQAGEALHAATFLAHPVACAAALAALDVLESEALPERAARLGTEIAARREGWLENEAVVDLRGRGLFWVLELASPELASRLARRSLERGLYALASGTRMQLVPPLTIHRRQWGYVLETLGELLATLSEGAAEQE
jgi:acetylornithine/succinyldiaminopimelate/putrescine aminotransferase